MKFLIYFSLFLLFPEFSNNFSYSSKPVKEIGSVVGSIGQLPCYVQHNIQDVAMILWFKENSGTPIYSYDGRNEKDPPRHLPLRNEFGLRLHFRIPSFYSTSSSRPPALLIRNLQISDAGTYRCRIDYRNSPTTNLLIRLNVIQPPHRLQIQDGSNSRPISDQEQQDQNKVNSDITYMGPYLEGQNVSILCTAFGGLPRPEVVWYKNGLITDWSWIEIGNESVANELQILNLMRNSSYDLYTCQASNNNESKPISHRVNVDVYSTVKEIEVEIPDEMIAGVEYNFICTSKGSYPSVKIEFWKQGKKIGPRFQMKSDAEISTVYKLPFTPTGDDNEEFVSCKSENPWIPGNFIESGRKLNVYYPPVVVLRFGSSKRKNFSEGESLLLECHVRSNPEFQSIIWIHEGNIITENRKNGIHLNGMTLILNQLTSESIGEYSCESWNRIGKGVSNTIQIQVNVSPKCVWSGEKVIPLAIGGSHQLRCDIIAWPPDLNFYWTLNQSRRDIIPISSLTQIIKTNLSLQDLGKTLEFSSIQGNKRIFHQSILEYTINNEEDYGTVGCWAKNSFGKQIFPCLFFLTQPAPVSVSEVYTLNITEEETNWINPSSNTFLTLFHPSYIFILIGLLIFITLTCLLSFTFCWIYSIKRRRREPQL